MNKNHFRPLVLQRNFFLFKFHLLQCCPLLSRPLCHRVCSSVFLGSVVLCQALVSSWRSQKSTAARNEEVARNIFQLILVSKVHRTARKRVRIVISLPVRRRNSGLKPPAGDRHHRDKPGVLERMALCVKFSKYSLQNSNLDLSGYTPELCRFVSPL